MANEPPMTDEEVRTWIGRRGLALEHLESQCPPWCEDEGPDHLDISKEGGDATDDAEIMHRRYFSPSPVRVEVCQYHRYGEQPSDPTVYVSVEDSLSMEEARLLLEKLRSAYVFAAGVKAVRPRISGSGGFVGITDEHVHVMLSALAEAKSMSELETLRWVAEQPTEY